MYSNVLEIPLIYVYQVLWQTNRIKSQSIFEKIKHIVKNGEHHFSVLYEQHPKKRKQP